jgi:uncharacterized membrane protein YecN with MAPEG domain
MFLTRMPTTQQQLVSAVTNYTLEYLQQWHRAVVGEFEITAARLLLAAGRGPARFPTCEQTFRHTKLHDFAPSALLRRAVALLGAGELRTLRVTDPTVVTFVLSALVQRLREQHTVSHAVEASRVFAPLRVVEWTGKATFPEAAFTLIDRYAANITELDCPLGGRWDAADNLLARCIRLESLTNAQYYAPSAWLPLSNLHTLQGVDLSVVSMAAISAALPRLHILGVVSRPAGVPAAAVAGFFEHLLPRLQVFQYIGPWPQYLSTNGAVSWRAPLPLPQLRILRLRGFDNDPPPWTRFMGARPLELCTHDLILQNLSEGDDGDAVVLLNPLAAVRTLQVYVGSLMVFTPTYVMRMLRAAPHLETLIVSACSRVCVDSSWLGHAAFDELVHLKLRHVHLYGVWFAGGSSDFVPLLRQRHFPRLKAVAIDGRDYYVTPLEPLEPPVMSHFQRFVKFVAARVSEFWLHR